jgi:heme-degrading monooxygenase HmoA
MSVSEVETTGGGLRILFFARVAEGGEESFLAAYDQIRHRVAAAPGHLRDQLCQSPVDPQEWLITSEWESPSHYQDWAGAHRFSELSDPIVETTVTREHRPYLVRRSTT